MNLAELTAAVTKIMTERLRYYARNGTYAMLAAPDVFAIIPLTKRICGLRVFEGLTVSRGEFYVMRLCDIEESLIEEEKLTKTGQMP